MTTITLNRLYSFLFMTTFHHYNIMNWSRNKITKFRVGNKTQLLQVSETESLDNDEPNTHDVTYEIIPDKADQKQPDFYVSFAVSWKLCQNTFKKNWA